MLVVLYLVACVVIAVHPDDPIVHDDEVLHLPILLGPLSELWEGVYEVSRLETKDDVATSCVLEYDLLMSEDGYLGGLLDFRLFDLLSWSFELLRSRLKEVNLFPQLNEVVHPYVLLHAFLHSVDITEFVNS